MSQTNSGKSVSERLASLLERLDAYDRQMGIAVTLSGETQTEAQRLIEMPPESIRRMTKEEKDDGAFILQQMGFFLQKAINQENAVVYWAEQNLGRIISPIVGDLKGYYSAEERKMAALRSNDAAKELHAIIVERRLRLEKLSFLINRIENLSKALMSRRV
jgi:hypothetical protein